MNAPTYNDLVQALRLIEHATAPTPSDGGYHEAAYELATGVLGRLREAPPSPQPEQAPVTKQWCQDHPASAAYIINTLAARLDAQPEPAARPLSLRCAGCDISNGCPEYCRCGNQPEPAAQAQTVPLQCGLDEPAPVRAALTDDRCDYPTCSRKCGRVEGYCRFTPCCANENRSMRGGCLSCGDPCL